ncbi:energy transducer TonB [Algoriphagus sp. CAU 1675]|uniref:energy transducer TonB n=1 Tax=Algoriphagus sp. CAU 1675 TaxID=3032597 RepID=UPI0023D9865D|nr:energy transducer TonB [Algoriphagus sp. CAU 1675]MDF2158248.1 energy transducer TonB [Algoriphagus sp. CAU 1675]
MRTVLLLFAFLFIYNFCNAQYVRFIDRYDLEVEDTTQSDFTYFELIWEFGQAVKIERFRKDSVKVSESTTLFDSLGNVKGLRIRELFESGKTEFVYSGDKPKREIEKIRYYENGEVKSQKFYLEEKLVNEAYFDQEGQSVSYLESREATPNGGHEGWTNYMIKNLSYPQAARSAGAVGTVIVICLVDKEGNVKDPQIINKGECHPSLEREAQRLIEKYPDKFIPQWKMEKW